jgi:hypothetical protein
VEGGRREEQANRADSTPVMISPGPFPLKVTDPTADRGWCKWATWTGFEGKRPNHGGGESDDGGNEYVTKCVTVAQLKCPDADILVYVTNYKCRHPACKDYDQCDRSRRYDGVNDDIEVYSDKVS